MYEYFMQKKLCAIYLVCMHTSNILYAYNNYNKNSFQRWNINIYTFQYILKCYFLILLIMGFDVFNIS